MSTTASVLTQEPSVVPNASTTPPQDWRTSLPEDMRADKSFESFKDIGSFAKSFLDTKRMVGDAIRMPKADAPPEEWNKIYDRLGRPESPEKYEIKRPELPEGTPYDEDAEKSYKTWAHEAGLNPRQAQALFDKYTAFQTEKISNYTKEMETGVTELKKEWGGDYDKRIGLAQRAVNEVAGEDVKKLLGDTGLGNHPVLIKFFSELGSQMGEAALILGNEQINAGGVDAIQAKIDAIRNDPNHPYQNPKATQKSHEAAILEMNKLYEQLTAAKGEGGGVE